MPRLPDPTPEQQALLDALPALADEKRDVIARYQDAVFAAADSGLTATQIAPYVGLTYQAVQSLLKRRGETR